MAAHPSVAYFSMEIALRSAMPTYAGGLGVLAGDTVRAAADMGMDMVAVSLLYRKGNFRQTLDEQGRQHENPVEWSVEEYLIEEQTRIQLRLNGREVTVRAWRYDLTGQFGDTVPVYFLDTDVEENSSWDRALTGQLYGGDELYRLCQEVLLGIGGVRMLRALGHQRVDRFHMNEGHSALLTFELLSERARAEGREQILYEDFEAVRKVCVFTTHTPVPAGHDQFPLEMVERVLTPGLHRYPSIRDRLTQQLMSNILNRDLSDTQHFAELLRPDVYLNMTLLALNMSRYVNGVAKRHQEISSLMYGGYSIDAITNGVHAATWTSPEMGALFDRYIPDWRKDNSSLRAALRIPAADIRATHRLALQRLVAMVRQRIGAELEPDVFTIGFARRATAYKRPDLLLKDPDRLRAIARRVGRFQVLYSGKAHPRDEEGKRLIEHIVQTAARLSDEIPIHYLPDYDMDVARDLVAGVDLWLNTPQPPNEASGTSGMKAALNGVPSLSELDGWWLEGHIEGVTGWSLNVADPSAPASEQDAVEALYHKLEHVILPLYYGDQGSWTEVMSHAIALNGTFFNTQRMMQQYLLKAYL